VVGKYHTYVENRQTGNRDDIGICLPKGDGTNKQEYQKEDLAHRGGLLCDGLKIWRQKIQKEYGADVPIKGVIMAGEILKSQNIANGHLKIKIADDALKDEPKKDKNKISRRQTLYAAFHKTHNIGIGRQRIVAADTGCEKADINAAVADGGEITEWAKIQWAMKEHDPNQSDAQPYLPMTQKVLNTHPIIS
jgi:hypothetical protein